MRVLCISITLILVICLPANAKSYLCVGSDFPILCEQQSDGEIKGLGIDVVRIIVKRMGHNVEFKLYPWKRAQEIVKKGLADILIPPYKTPEREQWLDYSKYPFNYDRNVFYVKSNSTLFWQGDYTKLRDKKIGVVLGWSYGSNFDKVKDKLLIENSSHIDKNFKKLIIGRTDMLVSNVREAVVSIKRLGIHDKVKQISPPLQETPNYIAFSKQKKNDLTVFRQKFDQLLQEMIDNGELAQMQNKYYRNSK